MKTQHIIAIMAIAVAVAIIIISTGDASQYVTFSQAFAMAAKGENSSVHVVGELTKDANGEVTGIVYDPLKDPNYLEFAVVDENQEVHKVVTYNPPPSMQDFKRSEKVVIVGKVKGEHFVASEVLLKCPSKYEETELK